MFRVIICALTLAVPFTLASRSASAAETQPVAAEADQLSPYYLGDWGPLAPYSEAREAALLMLALFDEETPSAARLEALGLSTADGVWIGVLRTRLAQHSREAAELRDKYQRGFREQCFSFSEQGFLTIRQPSGMDAWEVSVVEEEKDEVRLVLSGLAGERRRMRIRRIGADSLEVRMGSLHSFFFRTPEPLRTVALADGEMNE